MSVLKHWVFLEDIWNFNKWKLLDAMESNAKGNDNFAIKVISTENVEGKSYIFKINMKEVRKKIKLIFFIFQVITSSD